MAKVPDQPKQPARGPGEPNPQPKPRPQAQPQPQAKAPAQANAQATMQPQPPTSAASPSAPVATDGKGTKHPLAPLFALVGLLCLLVLGLSTLFGGSGSRGAVRATGLVIFGGKPLADATVTFDPASKDGKIAVGKTNGMGIFQLQTPGLGNGALPGDYRVTVARFISDQKTLTPEEAKEYVVREKKPPPVPKITNVVPSQYASPETSGLRATVKPRGGQPFRFELQ